MTVQSTAQALPEKLTASTWSIDPSHSAAVFTVRHAGIAKVRGSVDIIAGNVVIGSDLSTSSVTARLDPASINTKDANRDAHLRNADFFDVETYPTWEFTSTAIERDGEDYVIVGDLTIHGVTRPVRLATEFNGAATDPFGASRIGFSATTEISRKEFGLTWNAALETGGVLVSDNVKVSLDIEAVRQA